MPGGLPLILVENADNTVEFEPGLQRAATAQSLPRVLVLGASGFIGSAVAAHLAMRGYHVTGAGRSAPPFGLAKVGGAQIDLATATQEAWLGLLSDVEAVVNCVGILQDSRTESTEAVHATGLSVLVAACERAGVRRFVHLSAAGVDQPASAFSESKGKGEAAVSASTLDWFILRPSVVIGRAAYGGSALLRGLAALPVHARVPDSGPLDLVHLDDVVETIEICLRPDTPARRVLELAGPKRWSFDEAVRLFRRWLRFPPAVSLTLPRFVASLMFRAGDAISLLGWRPPVRTSAQREIARGATGDPTTWRETTGIVARDVAAELAREPASVQERWFARLYVLKPVIFLVFGLFWISTCYVSLGPGWEIGRNLLLEGGLGPRMATLTVIAGALADLVIGCAILYRPTSRWGLYAAFAISITYAVLGTILVPRLWDDPLGPMLKIWPIMVLNLVAIAILEDR